MVAFVLALLLQGTVGYESDAVRTDVLVADLARQSGRQLACDAVVASEPVVAQFKDRPLEEVMARLAEVVGGEWVARGSVEHLTRSSGLRLRQERDEAKRAAEALVHLGQEALRAADALPALDAREADLLVDRYRLATMDGATLDAERRRMIGVSPVNRAAIRVLAAMAPGSLSSMRIGERVVLSDRPTAVQGAWPAKASRALEELKRDAALLRAAKERLGVQQRPSMNIGGMVTVGTVPAEAGYGKTVLSVKRLGPWRFQLTVTMVGSDGANWLSGYTMLPEGPFASSNYTHEGPKLVISDTQRAFASMRRNVGYAWAGSRFGALPDGTGITGSIGVSMAENEGKRPDLGLAELLSDPTGQDPLGIVVGSLLRQIATESERPLLGTVADATIVGTLEAINSGQMLTHGDFLDYLTQVRVQEAQRVPNAAITNPGGWLEVVPSNPVAARTQRLDRVALKALEDSIRSDGAVTVSAALRYLEKAPARPSLASLDTLYLIHFFPAIDRASVGLLQSPALPFLGVSSGGLVRDLAPALRETVRRWVYEDQMFRGPEPMPEMANGPGPLASEPTEMFPEGVPPEARVSVERTDSPAVIARTESGFTVFLTPEDLGYREAYPDSPNPQMGAVPKLVGYRLATTTVYSVRLRLPGGRESAIAVVETKPLAGAKEGPRQALPQALLDRAEAARKAFTGG